MNIGKHDYETKNIDAYEFFIESNRNILTFRRSFFFSSNYKNLFTLISLVLFLYPRHPAHLDQLLHSDT